MKHILARTFSVLVFTFITAALSGCASSPNTFSNTAPDVDLAQYSTFGFFENLGTDEQGYQSMESNFLTVAMAQEMDRLGFVYSESPDLLINFYVHTKEKVRSRSVPTTSTYYGWRDPHYNSWGGYAGYETRIDQFTEGTLNVDLVDARTKKLVWEGAIVGRVTDRELSNLEQTIDAAVKAIMEGFSVVPVR